MRRSGKSLTNGTVFFSRGSGIGFTRSRSAMPRVHSALSESTGILRSRERPRVAGTTFLSRTTSPCWLREGSRSTAKNGLRACEILGGLREMTPRAFLNSLRTKTGAFLLFTVVVIVGLILWKGARFGHAQPAKDDLKTSDKTSAKPQVVQTVTRDVSAFSVPKGIAKGLPLFPLNRNLQNPKSQPKSPNQSLRGNA